MSTQTWKQLVDNFSAQNAELLMLFELYQSHYFRVALEKQQIEEINKKLQEELRQLRDENEALKSQMVHGSAVPISDQDVDYRDLWEFLDPGNNLQVHGNWQSPGTMAECEFNQMMDVFHQHWPSDTHELVQK